MERLLNAYNKNKGKNYHDVASDAYHRVYDNWSKFDKLTNTNCLKETPQTTFAELMGYFMGDAKNLDGFIRYDLLKECKDKQRYFELILACMTMANVFHEWGADDESKVCSKWYNKLFYNKNTYTKYVTEDELSDLWRLR